MTTKNDTCFLRNASFLCFALIFCWIAWYLAGRLGLINPSEAVWLLGFIVLSALLILLTGALWIAVIFKRVHYRWAYTLSGVPFMLYVLWVAQPQFQILIACIPLLFTLSAACGMYWASKRDYPEF